ncbi:MAG: DUF1592 domain-containing protein [Bryobacterales bacterium]|nr:DUF1592 domain-containing protein [Bryobacterales bacterium]
MLPRLCLAAVLLSLPGAAERVDPAEFVRKVKPFVQANCVVCHNKSVKQAEIDLASFGGISNDPKDRVVWEMAVHKIRTGEMPPKGTRRPAQTDIQAVTRWIESLFEQYDAATPPDPGRVTARRLNRTEYNNTIRDLLGVELRPADDFPADDAGYGFDNIGDVLSLSPVLMEKYLRSAERVTQAAFGTGPLPQPTVDRIQAERFRLDGTPARPGSRPGRLDLRYRFSHDAEYSFAISVTDRRTAGRSPEPATVVLTIDATPYPHKVDAGEYKPRRFETRVPLTAGEHTIEAAFVMDDAATAEQKFEESQPPDPEKKNRPKGVKVFVNLLEIRGPYDPAPVPAQSRRLIGSCDEDACAEPFVTRLARRAFRRPITREETAGLMRFYRMARAEGDSVAQALAVATQAMLVSPHFLFRIEPSEEGAAGAVHPVSEFALASRLSYFLWNTMPDDELFRLAGEKKLRANLEAQVRRLLADPKAAAFVENFGGQWLHLRNLESVQPDPDKFPQFDDELRTAMSEETRRFFAALIAEDRPVTEFLTARFTYVNDRLARHYGIEGVEGPTFQRIDLQDGRRGGILSHASVLTVSSYPTRTSPVIRGKWVLENLLGAPPPPPPDGVPELDESEVGLTGTLRQQMEKHRANPACSSCHARMDAIGFGLENYDAIGRWRTHDGAFPVESGGEMPGGETFGTPAELRDILARDPDAFTRCLTEKMLTYALGRGLEAYDRRVVKDIVREVARQDYRFSSLVLAIANSLPFQMRRAREGT